MQGPKRMYLRRSLRPATTFLGLWWIASCALLTGIPALDTPDGRVYAKRCGGCHGIPDPRLRTKAEWHEVLPKMDGLILEKGLPPLTNPEREAITRYLSLHAKS